MKYSCAIDFSGKEVSLALGCPDDREVIFEKFLAISGRDSSKLLPWLKSSIETHVESLNDICEWSVGTGPGSFTGLRLVAALISGLTLNTTNIRTRGIPGALAMADAASDTAKSEKIAVIFDGRRQELLLFEAEKKGNDKIGSSNVHGILSEANGGFEKLATYNTIAAMENDRNSIETLLPATLIERIYFLDHLPIAKLLFCNYEDWNKNLTELVYIRPAVFVKPRQVRKEL